MKDPSSLLGKIKRTIIAAQRVCFGKITRRQNCTEEVLPDREPIPTLQRSPSPDSALQLPLNQLPCVSTATNLTLKNNEPYTLDPVVDHTTLASLPLELLHLIVESTPLSYHSTTYSDRQKALYNLCLVSRALYRTARPLLLEIAKINSATGLDRLRKLLACRKGSEMAVKTLVAHSRGSPRKWLDTKALKEISGICPALSSLSIHVYGERDLKLTPLYGFKKLSDLRLYGVSCRPVAPLENLRSLSLSGHESTKTFCFNQNPIDLPSLRYLALSNTESAFHGRPLLENSILIRHLPLLDAWSIELAGLVDACSSGGTSILSPLLYHALVDCPMSSRYSNPAVSSTLKMVEHVRLIYTFNVMFRNVAVSDFTSAPTSLSFQPLLRSVYLNPRPEDGIKVDKVHEEVVQEVKRVCEGKGVEVVFEEQPRDTYTDATVSEEFWRRMKLERQRAGS